MISVCKTYEFAAAHWLPNHAGKCRNLHGHNYKVEVEIGGPIQTPRNDTSDGMVLDFSSLDNVVRPLIDEFDHCEGGLNQHKAFAAFVDDPALWGKYFPPTAENLVAYFVDRIRERIELGMVMSDLSQLALTVERVRVWETSKAWAEWKR